MGSASGKMKGSILGSVVANGNFWLCLIINIINKMGRSCVSQPVKLLGSTIGMPASLIGTAASVYLICSMVIRSPFGMMLDRYNKKLMLTGAFLIQGFSFLFYMFVDTPTMYFVAKVIEGFGFGVGYLAMTIIVAGTSDKKAMGSALGLMSMLPFIFASATNYITLQIRTLFGEEYSFIGGAACIAVCIVLSWLLRFDTKPAEFAEPVKTKEKRSKILVVSALPTAAIMIAVIIPTLEADNYLAIYGEEAGIPYYAEYLSIYMVANGLSSGVVGYLRDRFGTKVTVYPVILSGVLATLIIGFTTNQALWMLSAVLMGVAGGGILIICRAQAVLNSSAKDVGLAVATNAIVMDFGSIIMNPASGALADIFGYANMYKIIAALPVLAFVFTLLFYKKLFGKTARTEDDAQG